MIEVLFWILLALVVYAYVGYGVIMWLFVKVKNAVTKSSPAVESDHSDDDSLPSVTLLIAAYNEQDIVSSKMKNCNDLDYPSDKLSIVWVTDGSTDKTNELLESYPNVSVLFDPRRGGKAAAFNRSMPYVNTPLVVYCDANTMLCREAIREIVKCFYREDVGCVSGEKRVSQQGAQGATAGEGIYWRYESKIKTWESTLHSAVGAAGELFALRTSLYTPLPTDTLLDDFVLSIKVVEQGYRIAYCPKAYATETASADMTQEAKRKVRISAGGLQATWRLRNILNPFRYGIFSFQYFSHKTLRWTLAPVALFLLLPLNVALFVENPHSILYAVLLIGQICFYALGIYGMNCGTIKNKIVYIPYYFLFMNLCALKAIPYLYSHRGSGAWEKVKRL